MRARARRRLAVGLLVATALVTLDLSRAPESQWSARVALAAIAGYRAMISPWLGRAGVSCRFRPTCSRFAEAAIRADGAAVGGARALWRVARCGPWTPAGTVDPP